MRDASEHDVSELRRGWDDEAIHVRARDVVPGESDVYACAR